MVDEFDVAPSWSTLALKSQVSPSIRFILLRTNALKLIVIWLGWYDDVLYPVFVTSPKYILAASICQNTFNIWLDLKNKMTMIFPIWIYIWRDVLDGLSQDCCSLRILWFNSPIKTDLSWYNWHITVSSVEHQ